MTNFHILHNPLQSNDCFLNHAVRNRQFSINNIILMQRRVTQERYSASRRQRLASHDLSDDSVEDLVFEDST